jgi:hypothetical protein
MRRTRGSAAVTMNGMSRTGLFGGSCVMEPIPWNRRLPRKSGKYSAEKTHRGKVRAPSLDGHSNAASNGRSSWMSFAIGKRGVMGHREEHSRRSHPALPGIEARFDCFAKPVIGRIRALDSPAPHSVNRSSGEVHRPTGRRSGALDRETTIPDA